MSRIRIASPAEWRAVAPRDVALDATLDLEAGHVLFLPHLRFSIESKDAEVFSPSILSASKNASFDPSVGRVTGTTLSGEPLARLGRLIARFSAEAASLVDQLFPAYRGRVQMARASFRPAEIAGRQTSWRKDDSRLHVDSFPASPVQGRRILRVFSNVNPGGRPRSWRVGGDFGELVERFSSRLAVPWPGSAVLLQFLHVTKTRRTAYDALMLQLHDRMKADSVYQEECEQEAFDFPAGTTWVAFTDQVSHAAMAGQYQLEQTFLLPVDAMLDPGRSPLRILERAKRRSLV